VHDDAHDPGLANNCAVLVAPEDGFEEARLESVDLRARVPQSGDLDDCLLTEVQEPAAWQPEQVDANGQDVLSQLSRENVEALLAQLGVQLGVDQVYLALVGLGGISSQAGCSRTRLTRSLSEDRLRSRDRCRLEHMPPSWSLRPATADDAQWMADLKAVAMRPDLERLGHWHRDRARQRFLDTYIPRNTRVIVIDRWAAGLIAVRPEPDALWIEHFYLDEAFQGRGIGGQVLDHVMATGDTRPFNLSVIRGSGARRLYERHGFFYQYDDENGVDQILGTTVGRQDPASH